MSSTSTYVGRLDSYQITDEKSFGRGGVGTVYKVLSLAGKQEYVIKLLHGERFEINDRTVTRFRNESQLLCSIKSEYIVKGIDYEKDESGAPFLVMEFLRGGNLSERIKKQDYDSNQILQWMCQLLKGFLHLKRNNIVHRDLHPKNILLDEKGNIKISDFGIAKDLNANSELTLTIDKLGSLLYISEFQRQHPAEAKSKDDFYSLCIIMYELISGKRIHTIAPTLASLPNLKIPIALARLIDAGISYSTEWESVLSELCVCLDLTKEDLSDDYEGSVFTPDWRLSYDAKNYLIEGKKYAHAISGIANVSNGKNSLLDEVSSFIADGFNKARAELFVHNIRIDISTEIHANSQNFSASLNGEYLQVMQEADVTEDFEDRFYGWIMYDFKNNDQTIVIGDINGKRLYPDLDKLPDETFEREITKLDSDSITFLKRVGHTLGYGVAYAALNRFVDVLENKANSKE